MLRYSCLCLAVLMAVAGCQIIDYRPDPERTTYLVAKDATYGLWRFKALTLEDLRRAKPHLEALRVALEAKDEPSLDTILSAYLTGWTDGLPEAADRHIAAELVRQTLEDLRLVNPEILTSRAKTTALIVVGGILDGIAHVEEAVRENAGAGTS